jgi:hypothetical protein
LLVLEATYLRCSQSSSFAPSLFRLGARIRAPPPGILEGSPEWKIDVSPGIILVEPPIIECSELENNSAAERAADD